jgi:wyosine [tRNA(Phe)-imidazoG37] synthetase (radical SAM superfamily)
MNNPKDFICRDLWAYPVIDLTRPRVRTCCKRHGELVHETQLTQHGKDVFLNLPNTIKDRKLMLDGIRPNECKACWDLEDRGLRSFRQGHSEFQFHFNNIKGEPPHYSDFKSFEQLIEIKEELLYSDKPNKLDLTLGTYCDQKCIYCSGDYSTQWETEDRKYGILYGDPTETKGVDYPSINGQLLNGWYDSFLAWFDTIYEHLERIALLGGEPTFSPMFVPLSNHIVERLKTNAHPNCTLSIVTNLNWKKDVLEQIFHIRKELPSTVKLVLEVSMESFGKRAEYIRHGIKWDRFVDNLNSVAALDNVEIKLITTLNGLCITSIKDYFEMIKLIEFENDKSFQVIVNRLVFPKWLSFDILDPTFKPYFTDFIQWLELYGDESKQELLRTMQQAVLELDSPRDPNLMGYFIKWVAAIDKRRDLDFKLIFPEFNYIFEKYDKYSQQFFTLSDVKGKWLL